VRMLRWTCLRWCRLNLVEVHILVLAALPLVVLDPDPSTLKFARLGPDRFAKRRVLVALRVADHVAHIASPGLESAHLIDRGHCFHVRAIPIPTASKRAGARPLMVVRQIGP